MNRNQERYQSLIYKSPNQPEPKDFLKNLKPNEYSIVLDLLQFLSANKELCGLAGEDQLQNQRVETEKRN